MMLLVRFQNCPFPTNFEFFTLSNTYELRGVGFSTSQAFLLQFCVVFSFLNQFVPAVGLGLSARAHLRQFTK